MSSLFDAIDLSTVVTSVTGVGATIVAIGLAFAGIALVKKLTKSAT